MRERYLKVFSIARRSASELLKRNFGLTLSLSALVAVSIIVVKSMFGGKEFLYMQDTFLTLSTRFLSNEVFYIWKDIGQGTAYISNGYLFYYLLLRMMDALGASASVSEQAYVFLLVFGTTLCFFSVTLSILKSRTVYANIICTLGAIAYTFNAYSLSVNWFLIENWTAYALLFPLLFLMIYRVAVERRNYLVPSLLFVCISQLFQFGLEGPFLVSSLFVATLIAISYNALSRNLRGGLTALAKLLGFILVAALPSLIASQITTALPILSAGTTNLLAQMQSESASTTLLNIFTLSGFTWLQTSPFLFPWFTNNIIRSLMQYLAVSMVIVFSYYVLSRKFNRKFYLSLAVASVFIIFFMKGLQPPFGTITYDLVLTGFLPFYILINPYYFLGQALVFLLVFVLSLACFERVRNHRLCRPDKIITLLILALLVVSAFSSLFIVSSGMIYPNPNQAGNDIHRISVFNLPTAFSELGSYFKNQSDNGRAILFPPLIGGVDYLKLSNGTIVETSHLMDQLIPVSVVTSGPIAQQAWSYALQDPVSLAEFLKLNSIQYVIFNAHSGDPAYASGNLTTIEDSLSEYGLFTTSNVGGFQVLSLKDTAFPSIYVSTTLINADAQNFNSATISYLETHSSNATIPVFIGSNESSLAERYAPTVYDAPNITDFSLSKFDWDGTIFFPYSTNAFSIGSNSSSTPDAFPYLGTRDWALYLSGKYTDFANDTWKNVIISSGNYSVYVQMFVNHSSPSSVISVQYYSVKTGALLDWYNIATGAVRTNDTYELAVIDTQQDLWVQGEIGSKPFNTEFPLRTQITSPTLSFDDTNAAWNATYSIFALNSTNVEANSNANVSYQQKQLNPSKYEVSIEARSKTVAIVLGQQYDPGWQLVIKGGANYSAYHVVANGYANAWFISSDFDIGNITCVILYRTQTYYDTSNYVSLALFTGCISGLTVLFVQSKVASNKRAVANKKRSE